MINIDLESEHHESNNTGQGQRADKLGSTAGGRGAAGAGGGGGVRGDDVGASNAGAVVVDDDGATDEGAVNISGEAELGVDVGGEGHDTVLGAHEVAVLAGQVTGLAGGQVSGVAGLGSTDVGGVEVAAGQGAVAVDDRLDVDVVVVTGGEDALGNGQACARDGDVDTLRVGGEDELDIDAISVLDLGNTGGGDSSSSKAGNGESRGDGFDLHGWLCVDVCERVRVSG